MASRLFSATDAALFAGLPGLVSLAWAVPPRLWPRICTALAPYLRARLIEDIEATKARITSILHLVQDAPTIDDILTELTAEQLLAILQMLRSYRPGEWNPSIRVTGRAHYDEAKRSGKGVVFWVSPFVHLDLMVKVALAQIGVNLHHLSHPSHGLSVTRFGVCVLNRIQLRAEDRFLSERVILAPGNLGASLLKLARLLRTNGSVSITAIRPLFPSTKSIIVPVLGGELALARGAPVLSCKTGAALLPVFIEREDSMTYRVEICADLRSSKKHCDLEPEAALAHRYGDELSKKIGESPGQYRGWVQF